MPTRIATDDNEASGKIDRKDRTLLGWFDYIYYEGEFFVDRAALALVVTGALNWLIIGLFNYDLLAGILGGQTSFLTRAAYTLIGIAGIWALSLLFRKSAYRA